MLHPGRVAVFAWTFKRHWARRRVCDVVILVIFARACWEVRVICGTPANKNIGLARRGNWSGAPV